MHRKIISVREIIGDPAILTGWDVRLGILLIQMREWPEKVATQSMTSLLASLKGDFRGSLAVMERLNIKGAAANYTLSRKFLEMCRQQIAAFLPANAWDRLAFAIEVYSAGLDSGQYFLAAIDLGFKGDRSVQEKARFLKQAAAYYGRAVETEAEMDKLIAVYRDILQLAPGDIEVESTIRELLVRRATGQR
jgi:hypothetical protein